MNVKIYDLNKGDLFRLYRPSGGLSDPLRYHGIDGMYARITTPEFTDLNDAFEAERVSYISCGAEVEKINET